MIEDAVRFDGDLPRLAVRRRQLPCGLEVIVHRQNRGYGGNQKTCYDAALEAGADVVVMLHPDYQYDSRAIPVAASIIELGNCDVVLGNRIRSRAEALSGGMPSPTCTTWPNAT